MAELNIPDEVRATGFAAFAEAVQGGYDGPQIYAQTLAVAAPLIVAAELERIAALWKPLRDEMREVDNRTVRSSALGVAISDLERRASELRGEASNG